MTWPLKWTENVKKKKRTIFGTISTSLTVGVVQKHWENSLVCGYCVVRLRLSLVPIMYFSAAPVCVFSADIPTQALPLLLHSKLQACWPQSVVSFVITFPHFFSEHIKLLFSESSNAVSLTVSHLVSVSWLFKAPKMTPRVVRSLAIHPPCVMADWTVFIKFREHSVKDIKINHFGGSSCFLPPVPSKSFLLPDWIGGCKHSGSCCFGVCRKR